jgi:hypothetical protein
MAILPIWLSDDLSRAKAYPYLWYWIGKERHLNYAAYCFVIGFVFLVVAQIADKKLMATEMKGLVSDREFLEAYCKTVESSILTVRAADGMSPAELIRARRLILQGICLVVHQYHDKSPHLNINACYMVAYPTTSAPAGIESRLKFKEDDRLLSSYAHVLDLTLWAEDRNELPKELALPVEDPSDPNKRLRLLPGAPAAYALDQVCAIADTRDLKQYFENGGRFVDREIARQQTDFFEKQGFRSFASFPLNHDGVIRGVLNVQSARPFILGRESEHENMVTELLRPLRTAMAILI